MSGAYQLSMSRATVTEFHHGVATGRSWGPGTVTVRNGVAKVKVGHAEPVTMNATTATRQSSGQWTVEGPEGLTWSVTKKCGCGGGA